MINVYYISRTVWIAFICQTRNVNELHRRCISAFSERVTWHCYILGKCGSYRTRIWKFRKDNIIETQFCGHPVSPNPICRESGTFNGDNKSIETRYLFFLFHMGNELESLRAFCLERKSIVVLRSRASVSATSRDRYAARITSATSRFVLRTSPAARTRKLNALPERRVLPVTCTSLLSSL